MSGKKDPSYKCIKKNRGKHTKRYDCCKCEYRTFILSKMWWHLHKEHNNKQQAEPTNE